MSVNDDIGIPVYVIISGIDKKGAIQVVIFIKIMFQIIIGCVLANILTIAIIGLALYLVYRKNEDRLKALDSKIDQKVEDVKNKVGAVMDIVDQIKKLLDKINKK